MAVSSRASRRAWIVCASVFLVLGLGGLAVAHPAPNSTLQIDIGQTSVGIEVAIPIVELEAALRPQLGEQARGIVESDRPAIGRYLLDHVGARSPDGRAWAVQLRSLSTGNLGDHDALIARLDLRVPPGAGSRRFDLRFDAITHEVMSHVVVVLLRSDFYKGELLVEPQLVAGLQHPVTSLHIDRGQARSWLAGLIAAFNLGLQHIAEGTDHLLFLLTLTLVAPVAARDRRWEISVECRAPALKLLWAIAAFSAGHSLSVVLGVGLEWRFPSAPVELLVAVSILVGAIHAWKPIFPNREPWVAGGFGLVHGAAISTAIGSFGLDAMARSIALVGFTAGIGALQVVLAAVALLTLMMLRTSFAFSFVRHVLIALSAVAAVGWIVERAPAGLSISTAALSERDPRGSWVALTQRQRLFGPSERCDRTVRHAGRSDPHVERTRVQKS